MGKSSDEDIVTILRIFAGIGKIQNVVNAWFNDNNEIVDAVDKQLGLFVATAGLISKDICTTLEARMRNYPNLIDHLVEYAKRGWFISLYFGFSELDELALKCQNIAAERSERIDSPPIDRVEHIHARRL